MNANSTLLQQNWNFLRARAVADDVAIERGYLSAARKSDLERLGFGRTQQLVPALVIPVWSVRGQVEAYQLRPDKPRLNDQGRQRKYEMKAGSRMLLDVHPRLKRQRAAAETPLIEDPAIPLFVTEGVPKADAAISIGLCCIALLGVFNFRGSNEAGGKTALADWEAIALNERTVYVAFDSDVMEKPNVYAALTRIKALLESRKAKVRLLYLPAGKNGEKTGLDDYIAREKAASRTDAEIRDDLLALATSELRRLTYQATGRPEIFIEAGQQPKLIDDAEKVLAANATQLGIFQRGGEIVRIITLDRESHRGRLLRVPGSIQLAPLSTFNLLEVFDRLIAWIRPGGKDGPKPADCPMKIAATYLARLDWRLPTLAGVVEAPIMRPDGSILSAFGYDTRTGLYLQVEADWPKVPDEPTRADALVAANALFRPFAEFPFIDEAARSVFVAAILTAIQRRLLESAPIFAFDAPSQRSGKSLMAEAVGLLATGRKPAATGVSSQPEELRKAITSALRENQPIVNLDNITHVLSSADLARAVTQSEYSDRLLGMNRMLRLPTNILWTATGNNLTVRGDLPSRTLLCRIDAKLERPEERTFKIPNLSAYLAENRKQLVTAALTVLRAYYVAGRPQQNVLPWGGFQQWSREIREALVWLGWTDPCATRERLIANDPERDSAIAILSLWHEMFGDRAILAAEVIRRAEAVPELKERLLAVSAGRNNSTVIDARRLGFWCSSTEDRVIGDFQLRRDRTVQRATTWRVSCVSSVSSQLPATTSATHMPSREGFNTIESVRTAASSDRPETNSPNSPNSPNSLAANKSPIEVVAIEIEDEGDILT